MVKLNKVLFNRPGDFLMKTKNLSMEVQLKRLKKRFYVTSSILAAVILLFGYFIYLNSDYLTFKYFITKFYIYTDTMDELYKKELKRDIKGKYFSYFDGLVISIVTRQIREENNDRYTYLYTPEHYLKFKSEEKEEALKSDIRELNDKTVYMRITNFSKYTEKFIKENIGQLQNYPYLIIDLRDNYGGDIDAMAAISDLFLPKGSIISTDKMRMLNRTYKAKKGKLLNFEKIIILQNNNTASASENMISALKDNLDNVTLIGERTFGKGIGQYTLPLKKGFAVKATILQWFTPKGSHIQGKGIAPDILYKEKDVLEFALNTLQE
jgi:hypothetical protein